MADNNVTTSMLYHEFNEFRKEQNEKFDALSKQIQKINDNRVSHRELQMYVEPIKQKVLSHERIMWGIGAAAGVALLNAIFNLIIQ